MTAKRPALLGLDVGTSGVKALLYFLPDGRAAPVPPPRVARAGLAVRRPRAGHSEIDPPAWWRAVARAAARLEMGDAHVLGLGTSTLFPALVAMDADGRPVRPAILYDDRRSLAEVAEFERSLHGHPALQHLLTGNRLRAGTISLSSLLWMRRQEPRLLARTRTVGHAGTYVGLRLTGRLAMDAASASLTGLYATASGEAWLRGVCRARGLAAEKGGPRAAGMTCGQYLDLLAGDRPALRERILADLPPGLGRAALLKQKLPLPEGGWVRPLLDAVGLPPDRMPQVLWPPDRLGELTDAAARTLGLAPGIPVAAGAGDAVCGALGLGLDREGEMIVTCGSTDCLASLERNAAFSTRTINMAYMDGRTWLAVAPMNASGAAVDWFAGRFLGGRRRYERFFALAAQAPPGSGGVVFLPYLAGERSPVYDPAAKAVFFGLTLSAGLPEMARAVLEGIAFGHRQILRMTDVRLGRRVGHVVAAGGATRDPLWRQIRADAADRPYRYADRTEASALGAALLGGVAAVVFSSWKDAAAEARRTVRFDEIRPQPGAWHALRRNFEVYDGLYDALKHCFDR
jgi:sugar (pentulose or hexulose) kinase